MSDIYIEIPHPNEEENERKRKKLQVQRNELNYFEDLHYMICEHKKLAI